MAHTWFYNEVSGLIVHETNGLLQAAMDHTPTWHGFNSKADAQAYKKVHPPSVGGLGDAANAVTAAPRSIETLVGALMDRNTWIRAAEVIIGALLIVVGLVKLTPPSVAQNVKSIGKVAALL